MMTNRTEYLSCVYKLAICASFIYKVSVQVFAQIFIASLNFLLFICRNALYLDINSLPCTYNIFHI